MFTGHQLVICLLIAFQFQATIGNINCDYQFIRNSCSSSSIACSLAKPTWRNASVNHLVVWSISSNDSICQTPNACWQTNIQNCSYPEIQIKPLEIQDGDSVSLQILEVDNSSIVMNITNVTYYDFKRCSESYGLNRSDNILSGNGSIEIDSQMLRPGIHYFVSLLTENIYYCGFGYRQIIISRSNDCRAPGSPGNVKQCNGHGSCNVTSADNFLIRCQCDKDAIGRYCQEYNACYVNPCSNNASCHDIQGDFNSYDYNCSCQEGYTGKNCSDIIDYCQSNPCQNNNPCEPAFNGYSCRCSIAYYGTYCELYQDLCVVLNNPCSDKVGYQCVSNQGSYKCIRVAVPVSVQFYQVHPSCSFYRNNPQQLYTEMIANIQKHCNCNFTDVDLGTTNDSIICISESDMLYNVTMYSVSNISVENLLCTFKQWTGPGSRLEIIEPQLLVCSIEYAARLTKTEEALIGIGAAVFFVLVLLLLVWIFMRIRRKLGGSKSVPRQTHPKESILIARKNFSVTPAVTEFVSVQKRNGNSTTSVGLPSAGILSGAHDNPHHENYEMSHLNNGNHHGNQPKITITPDTEDAPTKLPGSHTNNNFDNHDRLV